MRNLSLHTPFKNWIVFSQGFLNICFKFLSHTAYVRHNKILLMPIIIWKKKAQVPGKFQETNKQKNILKWPLTTLLCNLVTIIVILKHALYLKKYAWHCLTQNICSSVSPIKKIYFEICSKTTRWVVEKMSECNIQQCSGGPSEGPGLGPAHWGKPSHRKWWSFGTFGLEQFLGAKGHIFRSFQVSAQAGVPIKEVPDIYLRLFLHNLLLWSTIPV